MARLQHKVALVTGAGSGLGWAQALTLAEQGARVIATDIQGEQAERAAERIRRQGGQAIALTHNVTSEPEWAAVIEQALGTYGQLDVVVNNAGIAAGGNAEEGSLEDWRRVMDVNLDAVFIGTQHAIRAMKPRRTGSIVNISSIMGLVGTAGSAAYNASKGGVRLLTKSAALHCAKSGYGIRVNSVHPGFIDTPMIQRLFAGPNGDAARAQLIGLHPIGRLGTAQDIAHGVLFLASDESAFMTGSELVIDGGYTAQ
ncbi:MAG: glucose 1-dehydrogenase [Pseudomonadota bacterium]|nr:glucose 1-dehydrogenase [Pseudomonadota bacterium]